MIIFNECVCRQTTRQTGGNVQETDIYKAFNKKTINDIYN